VRRLHAKLLGGHLCQRHPHSRSNIDLARIQGDGTVGMNREQAVDLTWIERPGGIAGGRRRLRRTATLGSARPGGKRKAHDKGTARLQQVAPR